MDRPKVGLSWDVLAAVSAGGALGSLARWGAGLAWPFRPHEMPDALPWGTFGVNVVGSTALGVIMVLVLEVRPLSRLARPFWGVGVCGGFTTFSALQFEVYELYSLGRVGVALGYFVASVTVGVLALVLGMVVTRGVVGERP